MTDNTFLPLCQGTPEEPMEIEKALVKISKLQVDTAVYKANANEDKAMIESLKEAVETAKKETEIVRARNNTLEVEVIDKDSKISKFIDNFNDMKQKMEVSEKGNIGAAATKSLKEAKEETKTVKKELEKSQKRVENLQKKLNGETKDRAKAEAEAVRTSNALDVLIKKQEYQSSRRMKSESRDGRDKSRVRKRNRSRDGKRSCSKDRKRSKSRLYQTNTDFF